MAIHTDDELVKKIDRAWKEEGRKEVPRDYLGASILGHRCPRYLWLTFHNALEEDTSGRMYRLFNVGHREEEVFVKSLEMAGYKLANTENGQEWLQMSTHVGGHPDGNIVYGSVNAPCLVEFKTHKDSSFKELKKKGVQLAKNQHFVQMQVYMKAKGYSKALYMAVNKDTSEYYAEWVDYREDIATRYIDRGEEIAIADMMPKGISEDPTWFECVMNKQCHKFCFENKCSTQVNCRTCKYSYVKEDSRDWGCVRYGKIIPKDRWNKPYSCHIFNPCLVGFPVIKETTQFIIYNVNGKQLSNGVTAQDLPSQAFVQAVLYEQHNKEHGNE